MAMQISADSVMRAMAEEMGQACTTRLGEPATMRPAQGAAGTGWLFTVPVSGAARGRFTVWFERDAALALSRRATKLDTDPSDEAAMGFLRELVVLAMGALETKPVVAGITIGEPAAEAAAPPAQGQAFDVLLADGLTCRISLGAHLPPATASASATDLRLEAVFDVDLPLVVRFGRAVMPLRALADLGPGSVVDMGRSPDDPVELLVGDRVIARGEVVIVGGNYGVRITELTGAPQAAPETEARV